MKSWSVFDHELVPRHEILSRDEVRELLDSLEIPSTIKLPRIKLSDPVCMELKAKLGDVIKITRRSPTAGESVYYRVVIRG